MTSAIDTTLNDLAEDFDLFGDDWEERISYLIELGKGLKSFTLEEQSDENKVPGCVSQVWLITEAEADGALKFRGDSDAHTVKGLVAVLTKLLSGQQARDIIGFDVKAAFDRLGLSDHLSMQRSNGLKSMVARIQRDAQAALGKPRLA